MTCSYYKYVSFSPHEYFTNQAKYLPYPSPFSLLGAQDVLLSAQTQCSFVPHTHIYLPRPKKCYFHSHVYNFWQTMTSEAESSYQPNYFVCIKKNFERQSSNTRLLFCRLIFKWSSFSYGFFCLDSKWFLTKRQPFVRISNDPIKNPDHLQPNLFFTILNLDMSGFQIPTLHSPEPSSTRVYLNQINKNFKLQ